MITCPCERYGQCEVCQQLLRGEVNSMAYVQHVKDVVNRGQGVTLWAFWRCGNRDRIVGRGVTCERLRFHRGPHKQRGAIWLRRRPVSDVEAKPQ